MSPFYRSSDYYVEDDERACNTDDPDSERYNNMGKIKQELEFEQPVRAEHEEGKCEVILPTNNI